jgi:hypothetical protein
VVAEVIRTDATLCELLRAGRKAAAHEYWLRELGGQTTAQHAVEKVAAGLVDPRMAERVVGHLPPAADGERPAIGAVGVVGAAEPLAAQPAADLAGAPYDGTRGGSYGT